MTDKNARRANGFGPTTKSISAAKRDAAWMERIKTEKDADALSDLFEIYRPKLKGWLMARGVGDGTAEDIVQDVMIKVWTRAELFDAKKASFATWVYRLTRNRWIDHQRKHGRMDVRDPDLMKVIADDEVPSAEMGFMSQQSTEILHEHIGRLTEAQQMAIQMAFLEFKTHKHLARQEDKFL